MRRPLAPRPEPGGRAGLDRNGRRAGLDRNGRLAAWAWIALAVVSGVAWGLCFGRQGLVVAPWVALAPLVLLLGHPRAGRLAFLHGLASWVVAIVWIAPTLHTYGGLAWPLAACGLLLLSAYLALYHWAFARLGRGVWVAGGWLPLVALPALWVALEWLRTHLLSGFPWNLAAYSWVAVAGALPLAAWIGAYGVSFLVLFTAAGVAMAVRHRRWEPAALALLVPLALLALGERFGAGSPPADAAGGREGAPVRLVQPDIPNLVAWDPAAAEADYRKLLRLSDQACDRPGALLIWPESAAWPYSYESDPRLAADAGALAARGCPLLLNSIHQQGDRTFNSVYLVTGEGGPPQRYDKRHLVPFGEYVPLGSVLPFIGHLARNAGSFSAAGRVQLLDWGGERLGVAICFEVTLPGEVAELTRHGATLLATVTNDAWYGDTSAPWQHLRAARFRAAENRRPMLRAAITGVSAVIGADGRVEGELGVGEEGVIRARVTGRGGLSPFVRAPWLVPLACSLLAASAIFWRRRSRAR